MKRKIFISINIPEKAKRRLVQFVQKWQELPVKWTREANLHVTLLFLGHVDEETLPEICDRVRQVSENEDSFDIEFDKIEPFPSEKDPKMIVLSGPASPELLRLYENLEKNLNLFSASKKSFCPHITLGRIRKHKWEDLPSQPEILNDYSLFVSTETVDIMASDFGDRGQEYVVIESCPLK